MNWRVLVGRELPTFPSPIIQTPVQATPALSLVARSLLGPDLLVPKHLSSVGIQANVLSQEWFHGTGKPKFKVKSSQVVVGEVVGQTLDREQDTW